MASEAFIRVAIFLTLFLIFAALETRAPRRQLIQTRAKRWTTNLLISVINSLTLRFLSIALPFLAVGAAMDAESQNWGLFNVLNWPFWATFPLTILLFDFAIWLQHLLTHKLPVLWRFHRVHHADRDFDVTTALRFHPIEIAASMLVKITLAYALGPPAIAIFAFEIILNGTALFNHANLRMPTRLDQTLRLILVTPDMHRVHHSSIRSEHDSNYGFALSIWDRIFRTYKAQPSQGHDSMQIGLHWQDDNPAKLGWSLMLPFRG